MAGGQGAAGHQGADAALTLTVVVHDLAQGRDVLAAAHEVGLGVTLASAPGAAAYAGVGFLRALETELGCGLLIDCGDSAGLVMAGLRQGLRRLVFHGPPEPFARLEDMARQLGGELLADLPPKVLVLQPEQRGMAALQPTIREHAAALREKL